MFGDDATYMEAVHKTLKRGDVLRIKGNPPYESEDFHLFVVLNVDPSTEEVLLLVSGTSQVQKRLEARLKTSIDNGQDVHDTTHVFNAGSYSFTSKQTLFDCNEVYSVRMESVKRKNMLVVNTPLSEADINLLIEKVGNSKLVAPYIKKELGL